MTGVQTCALPIWRCFGRSCLASYATALVAVCLAITTNAVYDYSKAPDIAYKVTVAGVVSSLKLVAPVVLFLVLVGNVVPDYLSLLKTRLFLRLLPPNRSISMMTAVLVSDLCVTTLLAIIASRMAQLVAWKIVFFQNPLVRQYFSAFGVDFQPWRVPSKVPWWLLISAPNFYRLYFVIRNSQLLYVLPLFFTSIWLWLYAGSGFLLKAARRFDLGFEWFNRHFDIEKKPLQSIGLVAGALVAVVYWAAVIVSRVV